MERYQHGQLYWAFGAWHVRYRIVENGERKQRSHRLCSDGGKGKTKKAPKQAEELRADFMREINKHVDQPPTEQSGLAVVAFWEQTYFPFVEQECKPSTIYGYKYLWSQRLKDHFGNMTLAEYRTHHGSVFLTGLKRTLGHRTIQHIKSLCSGIFTHAVNLGKIESNPWHDAKVLGKTKKPGETRHYTLEEIENIISALVDRVDCQLIMALAFFLGLRKGEIQGLQWGDIDPQWLHVRRNITQRVITTPKTKKSVRNLPLIQPVMGLLSLWRTKCKPEQVWLFQSERGTAYDLDTLAVKIIKPILAKEKLEWKGYHAGRRGLGTMLRQLTGNSTAGRDVLGHEDEEVTEQHYEAPLPEVAVGALKMLEAKTIENK